MHQGFDWDGIQKAIEKNERKGKAVAGGSTITQQLAKNLFLSPERSLLRKGEEAVIAVMIETAWSKRRIFEVLNVIEWGNGIFGAEAAARHYYGISASQLSAEQAARVGGDGAESALLRPQPQCARPRPQERGHPRPHAIGADSLNTDRQQRWLRAPRGAHCCIATIGTIRCKPAASHFRSHSRGQLP